MSAHLSIHPPKSPVTLTFDPTWILIIPSALWAIHTGYVQVMGAFLSPLQSWLVSLMILLLVLAGLGCHVMAHILMAKRSVQEFSLTLPVLIFGDVAQGWPSALSPWRETVSVLAGPAVNLLLAGLAFLVWNAQLNPYLNLSMLFFCGFNVWLAVVNLIPVFPLDGGRLARTILRGLLGISPASASLETHLGISLTIDLDLNLGVNLKAGLGYLLSAALIAWGVYLISQGSRYSWHTGLATIAFAGLLILGLRLQSPRDTSLLSTSEVKTRARPLRAVLAGFLILVLLIPPGALVLTNNSLEAPGYALSVEPMVVVPMEYRHTPAGTFILTSVLSQEPILAGEWLAGKITPAIRIIPPEKPRPNEPSPQESARQSFQMLDQSESTAIVVGLRLAGYPAIEVGKGVVVISILPESPSQGKLQPDDVIVAFNGKPIRTTQDLIDAVKAQDPENSVTLSVQRGQNTEDVTVPLMTPNSPSDPPRIGITIDNAGFDYHLPFPVEIHPEKIVGGPSAGLMFTLTVYNLVSPQDLTGGRKIAGTGTINPDGTVGPIGGVEQKVVAAELTGAEYFLSPPDNYDAALSVAHRIKVVKVAGAEEAINFLRSLP
jgi:PDZ domain-containing protein